MRQLFRVIGYLLVTGGSLQSLGYLSHELDRAISIFGLGLFASTFASELDGARRPDRSSGRAGALLLAAAIPVAIFSPLGMPYFHLLVMAGAVLLLARTPSSTQAELRSYALAFCLVVLGAEVNRLLPLVWHFKEALAGDLSTVAERLAREARNLGPTAMGLPLLWAFVALAIGRAATRAGSGRPPLWASVVVLVLGHLAYLVLLTPYARWIARHRSAWEGLILNSQWLFLLMGSCLFVLMNGIAGRRAERRAPAAAGGTAERRAGAASAGAQVAEAAAIAWRRLLLDPRLIGGFALGVALVLLVGRSAPPRPAPVKVLLYDAGYLNWNVPVHGSYGEHSGGMFGLLPGLLQAGGCSVQTSADLKLLEGPGAPDCIVLTNIQEYLQPMDKERILRFVRQGGGLLCLGDHTGVAGIRGPFNDLLAPLGIRFRFDSASFFAGSWSNSLELRNHPMNRGIRDEEDYQIWVGASLDVDASATPIVVAKYGFSDLGNMANVQQAYLGDRLYNPSELLGDVVLVAEARLGRGKVIVFGDTSSYQNLALTRSYALVLRSVRYLGHPGGGRPGLTLQVLALLLFALGLGLVTRSGRNLLPLAATSAGILVASLAFSALARPHPDPVLDWGRITFVPEKAGSSYPRKMAIVDRSHGGRFDLLSWNDPSVGGLVLNLMRDGFFPAVVEAFPSRELEKAELVVVIAPSRSYARGERQALRRFLERGGRLLVCAGYEELDGARGLLADFGFDVRDLPLAHFRTGESHEDMVFREAWALGCPAGARVLVRQWGQPVVASLPVGRGELLVVGDSGFLLNRNLESRQTWFLGNIHFLAAFDSGKPLQPIEGRFGDPTEKPGPLMDAQAPPQVAPAPVAPVASPLQKLVSPGPVKRTPVQGGRPR